MKTWRTPEKLVTKRPEWPRFQQTCRKSARTDGSSGFILVLGYRSVDMQTIEKVYLRK